MAPRTKQTATAADSTAATGGGADQAADGVVSSDSALATDAPDTAATAEGGDTVTADAAPETVVQTTAATGAEWPNSQQFVFPAELQVTNNTPSDMHLPGGLFVQAYQTVSHPFENQKQLDALTDSAKQLAEVFGWEAPVTVKDTDA